MQNHSNNACLISAVYKAVVNHAEVRGSIPSTDVGKEPDRKIFAPMSDASVYRRVESKTTPFIKGG